MKPLEFKIESIPCSLGGEEQDSYLKITFYYEDNTTEVLECDYHCDLPKGLELNKHYSIADIYGYQVKNDREGL